MKTKLDYTVRTTRAPGETTDTWTPMIVDRLQPTGLESVIEKCIDRGLITGIKPTAAKTIADGVAEQLAYEFKQGRGIQFGQYFYGRPYLSGQVDPNGRLTDENSIDVRLYKGAAFKLSRDDFSLSFIEGGNNPTISFIVCDAEGMPRGEIGQGSNVKLNGKMLYGAGDTVKAKFADPDGTQPTVEVADFTAVSTELLAFACPEALVAGKQYNVSVERTDPNGVVRVSATKAVKVVAGAVPPGPPSTAPVVDSIAADAEGAEPGSIVKGEGVAISGSNFGEDGSEVSVKFAAEDGTEAWGSVLEATDGYVKTEWPDGLDEVAAGTEVAVTVTRSGETSSPVTVTVVSA